MKIGIIGGSGLYDFEGLKDPEAIQLSTPFGDPSDTFIQGVVHDTPVVFLPRHGKGHLLSPSEIPYKANIWAMKKLGVTHLFSVNAVGSLKEEMAPGDIAFPDQFVDWTRHRPSTFFGNGCVAHLQFGEPVCSKMKALLCKLAEQMKIKYHDGGTLICMEGPAFSSRAESELYRSWGMSLIGMTTIQEAKLAREAEISFANIAMVTDYDCWHQSEEEVSIEQIIKIMQANSKTVQRLLLHLFEQITPDFPHTQKNALQYAIVTNPEKIPQSTREELDIIIGRYL